VLDAALAGPVSVEDIVKCAHLEEREVLVALAELEIEGLVTRYADGRFGPR
jgi:predicted Rossmann fold nucleotide-binding protein DprA/Smf involved in DNA uptake